MTPEEQRLVLEKHIEIDCEIEAELRYKLEKTENELSQLKAGIVEYCGNVESAAVSMSVKYAVSQFLFLVD